MRPALWALTVAACVLVMSCGGGGSFGRQESASVRSSGVAVPSGGGPLIGLGGFAFFLANESAQAGLDLNGDGDAADNVVHAVDPATGTVINLGISGRPPFFANDTHVAWLASEADEGQTDLTGDGDFSDLTLVVFDPTLPVSPGNPFITGLPLVEGSPVASAGSFFAFPFVEATTGLGGTDLNGDGDILDAVIQFMDVATLTLFNSGLAWNVAGSTLVGGNGLFAFTVDEASQSVGGMGTDLNGDLDAVDSVLFAFDIVTTALIPVGPGGFPRAVHPFVPPIAGMPGSPRVAYCISESAEGAQSFNFSPAIGDIDTVDFVVAVFDTTTGVESLPYAGIAVDPFQVSAAGSRLAFVALESENATGLDFNSDIDTSDEIPFWSDVGILNHGLSTGVASVNGAASLQVCDTYLVFLASESNQGTGGTNYNASPWGDTDTDDAVAFYFDLTGPGIPGHNTGLATNGLICFRGENAFFITASESANGDFDLDGDGDASDIVPIYYRAGGPIAIRGADIVGTDGPLSIQFCPDAVRIFANAAESSGLGDMNGDEDEDDYVVIVHRLDRQTGAATNFTKVFTSDRDGTFFPFVGVPGAVIFPFSEEMLAAGANFNAPAGDADSSDHILMFWQGSCQ